MSDNDNCSICLEEIKENEIVTKLECNHVFHEECINEWANVSGKQRQDNMIWECPLCRYTIRSDNPMEMETDTIRYLTLVKFKRDRCFIMIVTFTDFLFSVWLVISASNVYNFIYSICSLYGFYGAERLNVNYLTSYSTFCFVSFLFRLFEILFIVYNSIEYGETSIITRMVMDDQLFMFMLCVTSFLQLYIIIVVSRMCNQIRQYGEQITYMIA